MTDIVERLRRTAGLGITNSRLMDEAANEIERLRAALEQIAMEQRGDTRKHKTICDPAGRNVARGPTRPPS